MSMQERLASPTRSGPPRGDFRPVCEPATKPAQPAIGGGTTLKEFAVLHPNAVLVRREALATALDICEDVVLVAEEDGELEVGRLGPGWYDLTRFSSEWCKRVHETYWVDGPGFERVRASFTARLDAWEQQWYEAEEERLRIEEAWVGGRAARGSD